MARRSFVASCIALSFVAISSVSAAPKPPSADTVRAALKAAHANPDDKNALAALLAVLPKVIRKEGGTNRTYYVFEGDQLMTPQFIQAALRDKAEDDQKSKDKALELVVMRSNGKDVFWGKNERALTYAVDRSSFRTKGEYDFAVKAVADAARDWVQACTSCGLSFSHRTELDSGTNFSDVTFVVEFNPAATSYIARSFFPNDPVYHRQLEIAPSYFSPDIANSISQTGIIRHELGHVLGYRHEHIQNVAGCNLEGTDWRPVTVYDPKSVMHYLCGGAGSAKLEFTQLDREGHRKIYQ